MKKISEINSEKVLICSDLHLSPKNIPITISFCNWIKKYYDQSENQQEGWFLILGDLFEHWVGDDLIYSSNDYEYKEIIELLRNSFQFLNNINVKIAIMHGNRDFLIGNRLLQYLHYHQLEPTIVLKSHKALNILLVHGDELCTDDKQHQVFRQTVNSKEWQNQFFSKSIDERLELAKIYRNKSETSKKEKSSFMMDINPQAADQLLERHDSQILIHGHTHLPGHSKLPSGKNRWVIPNWTIDNVGKVRGGAIQVNKNIVTQLSI